jgi:hypothetical protein
MKQNYFLRIGSDSLEQAIKCHSLRDAKDHFAEVARELDRYGQEIDASVHISDKRSTISEYPDYVLSLGPRGGIRVERT